MIVVPGVHNLKITRHLPGLAQRDKNGKIPFYRARIINQSPRVQWAETNHPEHKLVFFIGETYMYWCPKCQDTIYQEEVSRRGRFTCPLCEVRVLALSPGDWVRMHYRFHPTNEWGRWYGQRIL